MAALQLYFCRLIYYELMGGVVTINPEHYRKVNGYSNLYWGWGGEDDDLGYRMVVNNITIVRNPKNPVYYYTMLHHDKRKTEKSPKNVYVSKTDLYSDATCTCDGHELANEKKGLQI